MSSVYVTIAGKHLVPQVNAMSSFLLTESDEKRIALREKLFINATVTEEEIQAILKDQNQVYSAWVGKKKGELQKK